GSSCPLPHSNRQVAEQLSPLTLLPSSHCSPGERAPLPQPVNLQLLSQQSPFVVARLALVLYYLRTRRLQDRLAGAMVARSRLTRGGSRTVPGPPPPPAVARGATSGYSRRAERARRARAPRGAPRSET